MHVTRVRVHSPLISFFFLTKFSFMPTVSLPRLNSNKSFLMKFSSSKLKFKLQALFAPPSVGPMPPSREHRSLGDLGLAYGIYDFKLLGFQTFFKETEALTEILAKRLFSCS